jgi:hypothetical protein
VRPLCGEGGSARQKAKGKIQKAKVGKAVDRMRDTANWEAHIPSAVCRILLFPFDLSFVTRRTGINLNHCHPSCTFALCLVLRDACPNCKLQIQNSKAPIANHPSQITHHKWLQRLQKLYKVVQLLLAHIRRDAVRVLVVEHRPDFFQRQGLAIV